MCRHISFYDAANLMRSFLIKFAICKLGQSMPRLPYIIRIIIARPVIFCLKKTTESSSLLRSLLSSLAFCLWGYIRVMVAMMVAIAAATRLTRNADRYLSFK